MISINPTLVPGLKEGKIPASVLNGILTQHISMAADWLTQYNYYLGTMDIDDKTRTISSAPNNILVNAFPKYITDINVGYFLGNPITYKATEDKDADTLQSIVDKYKMQTISLEDMKNALYASQMGLSNEITYLNESGDVVSRAVNPMQGTLVVDDTLEANKLFGLYYIPVYDENGTATHYTYTIVTDTHMLKGDSTDMNHIEFTSSEPVAHFFGAVPYIEIRNNESYIGDYELVKSLIDAYNTLTSNNVDDIEQFVDAILVLKGAELTDEQLKLLREMKAMKLPIDGEAEYLTKQLEATGLDLGLTRLQKDIHKFSMTPDMTDENFAGNSSGVALEFKLLPFEMNTKNKQKYFEKALRERLSLYANLGVVKGDSNTIEPYNIQIQFKRGLPNNLVELATIVSQLANIAPQEDLLGLLPFIENPKEAVDSIKAENKEKQDQMSESFTNVGNTEAEDGKSKPKREDTQ